MKTKILLFGLLLSFIAIGCSNDEKENGALFTSEEATINAKIDILNDDVAKVVEDQLNTQEGMQGRAAQNLVAFLPECTTITRIPEFGTTITPGTLITKTLDFGNEGCEIPNGNVLKGKIIISFNYNPDATTHIINYAFDNFYHNAIKVEGNKSFTRVFSTSTANPDMHPIVTMNIDMTVTFPNGNNYQRIGTRVREIVEGYNTIPLLDNKYQVTGNWTTTFPNTTQQNSSIVNPLIIKLNCANIVQGSINFVRNNNTATLDYGDGSCDNQGVFSINGIDYNIFLSN